MSLSTCIEIHQQLETALICPHGDSASGRRLYQADGEALVQPAKSLCACNAGDASQGARVLGYVAVDVASPRRALDLYPLPDEVQGKHGRLGHDAADNTGGGVLAAPRHVEARQLDPQPLVRDEEDAHKGHDLAQSRADAPEEAPVPLIPPDVAHGAPQGAVYPAAALGGKPRPQQVERVRDRGGEGARGRARDEALGRVGQPCRQGRLQKQRRGAIRGELYGGVADVEQLRGDIALPECGEAFVPEDVPERGNGAAARGRGA